MPAAAGRRGELALSDVTGHKTFEDFFSIKKRNLNINSKIIFRSKKFCFLEVERILYYRSKIFFKI